MDSALRASLRLSKVRARGATQFVAPVRRREQTLSLFATTPPHPGDFVASLHPGYCPDRLKIAARRVRITA
jgi:hypothetical protein